MVVKWLYQYSVWQLNVCTSILVTCLTIPYNVLYNHIKIEPNTLIKVVKIKVVLIISIYKLIAWTDSISVRVYEDRMDFLMEVVVGGAGTPYQNGIFFFDIHFPFWYPDGPPVSTLLQLYDLKLKLLSKFCFDIQYGNI